jgi:hypothetical protein
MKSATLHLHLAQAPIQFSLYSEARFSLGLNWVILHFLFPSFTTLTNSLSLRTDHPHQLYEVAMTDLKIYFTKY